MADNLPDLSSIVPSEGASSAIVGIKAVFGWLGGSLASITAIFYATGYLLTRAHLSMLGLHGVIDFDNHDIVREGGKFFFVLGYGAMRGAAVPLSIVLGWIAIGAIALWWLLRSHIERRRAFLHNGLAVVRAQGWLRFLAFALLFLALHCHSETYLEKFQDPLCIENLLYAESVSALCSPEMMAGSPGKVKMALLRRIQGSEQFLDDTFAELCRGFVFAVGIAYFTWRTVRPSRWRWWYAAPSFLAAALYLILLPMDYGVLRRSIAYPRILLTPAENIAFPMTGPLFLLKETTREFVVWDASVRKLFWIPVDTVRRAELTGNYNVFDSTRYHPVTHGEKK
jgi:hypothetical protein